MKKTKRKVRTPSAAELDRTQSLPRSNRKRVAALQVGESTILVEGAKAEAGGPETQSYAIRAGIRVQTTRCFVIFPITGKMVAAVRVTRVE